MQNNRIIDLVVSHSAVITKMARNTSHRQVAMFKALDKEKYGLVVLLMAKMIVGTWVDVLRPSYVEVMIDLFQCNSLAEFKEFYGAIVQVAMNESLKETALNMGMQDELSNLVAEVVASKPSKGDETRS